MEGSSGDELANDGRYHSGSPGGLDNTIHNTSKRFKRKYPKHKDFVLDGVRVDSQKRFGRYDQLIDVHLIRFFERKAIQRNMKVAGIINKQGVLLDSTRTKEIRVKEAELKHLPEDLIKKEKERQFNLREKLNQ